MITYIFGKTGSGKSYKMVSLILDDLNKQKKVFSTIEFKDNIDNYVFLEAKILRAWLIGIQDIFIETQDEILDEEEVYRKIKNLPTKIYDCSLFIDEAHMYGFNDAKKVKFLMFFFSLQRHIGLDIYLGTQTHKQLNSLFHELGDTIITCISPTERLIPSMLEYRYYSDVSLIKNVSNSIKTEKIIPKKEVFALYTSGSNNQGNNAFRKKLLTIIIFLIFLIFFVFYQFTHLFSNNSLDQYQNKDVQLREVKENKNINSNKEIDKNSTKKKEVSSTKKKYFYINSSNSKYLVVSCNSYCSLFGYLIPKREFNKYFFSLSKKPRYKKYSDFYLVKVLRKDVITFLNENNYSSFSPLYSLIDWNK